MQRAMRALPERGIPLASTRGHMRLPARVGTPTMPLAQRSACAIPKTTLAKSASARTTVPAAMPVRATRARESAASSDSARSTVLAKPVPAYMIPDAPLPVGAPSMGANIPRNPETLMRTAVLPGTIPLARKASSKRSSSPKRFLASRSSSASTRKTRLIASSRASTAATATLRLEKAVRVRRCTRGKWARRIAVLPACRTRNHRPRRDAPAAVILKNPQRAS